MGRSRGSSSFNVDISSSTIANWISPSFTSSVCLASRTQPKATSRSTSRCLDLGPGCQVPSSRSHRSIECRTTTVSWVQVGGLALLALLILCGTTEAGPLPKDASRYSELGPLVYDHRPPPPVPAQWDDYRIQGRAAASATTRATESASASSSSPSGSAATASTATTGSAQASSTASASSTSSTPLATNAPLPTPFDTSIGTNFTTPSCPAFFNRFLANDTFIKCHAFSLLLQNSNSFFYASSNLASITQALDATCNVVFKPTCASLMASYAVQIVDPANCGADYALQNPLVNQAYSGFVAYEPLYDAACLKDTSSASNQYCFANAVTNTTNPADAYIYYLPLGVGLPGGDRPTCNTCTQQTMNVFANFAGNLTQPVSTDYTAAATIVNLDCGPSFVNASIPIDKGSGTSAGARTSQAHLYLSFGALLWALWTTAT